MTKKVEPSSAFFRYFAVRSSKTKNSGTEFPFSHIKEGKAATKKMITKQKRTRRIITGKDAVYMARALDRQNISYEKSEKGIAVVMNDSEYEEALEDAECEKEMEAINYRFCIISLRSGKRRKIMDSLGKTGYLVMQKDREAFEKMPEHN